MEAQEEECQPSTCQSSPVISNDGSDEEEEEIGVVEIEEISSGIPEHALHTKFQLCDKYANHDAFIPIRDFKEEHLPPKWRDPYITQLIRFHSQTVVKVTVSFTSHNRPEGYVYAAFAGNATKRFGTGRIIIGDDQDVDPQLCPIENCSVSNQPHLVTATFRVFTATHVVYDDAEAKETLLEFLYDSDQDIDQTVVTAKGIGVILGGKTNDMCRILCVSHDLNLLYKFMIAEFAQPQYPLPLPADREPLVIITSHPHGCSKHVSFGEIVGYTNEKPRPSSVDMKVADFITAVRQDPRFQAQGGVNTVGGFMSAKFIAELEEDCKKNPNLMASQLNESTDKLKLASIQYTAATCPGSSGAHVIIMVNTERVESAVVTLHCRYLPKAGCNASGKVYSNVEDALKEHLAFLRAERKKKRKEKVKSSSSQLVGSH